MILIGDSLVPYESISKIKSIDEIKNTQPNSTVTFTYDSGIMTYCKNNSVKYGVIVSSIKEAIYSNALGAKYIIANMQLASQIQKIAQNYMYDARVLAIISDSSEIEDIALQEIDGAIYNHII